MFFDKRSPFWCSSEKKTHKKINVKRWVNERRKGISIRISIKNLRANVRKTIEICKSNLYSSDADPPVLAKYVLALVQADPYRKDLAEICESKLDEFLGEETKNFVGLLQSALLEKSYLPMVPKEDEDLDHHRNKRARYEPGSDRSFNPNMPRHRYPENYSPVGPPEWQNGPWMNNYPPMGWNNMPPPSMHPQWNGRGMRRDDGYYRGMNRNGRGGGRGGRDRDRREQGSRDQGDRKREMSKTTLLVRKVDPAYVKMMQLTQHFSKFGNVVNVQMRPTEKIAYVQYELEEEATKAFQSPLPVCNNRFITLHRAKYDPNDISATVEIEQNDKTEVAKVEEPKLTTKEATAIAAEKGKQVLEEKKKLLGQQKELLGKRETLLQLQMKQQQLLLEKMKELGASDDDQKVVIDKLNELTQDLEAVQVEMGILPNKTNQLKELKSELSNLQHQAASMMGSARYKRGGRYNAPGRKGRQSNVLDNRTATFKVEKLPLQIQDKDALEKHFATFGTVVLITMDSDIKDTAYVQFENRRMAEIAFRKGMFYGEDTLTLWWIENSQVPGAANIQNTSSEEAPQEIPQQDSTDTPAEAIEIQDIHETNSVESKKDEGEVHTITKEDKSDGEVSDEDGEVSEDEVVQENEEDGDDASQQSSEESGVEQVSSE